MMFALQHPHVFIIGIYVGVLTLLMLALMVLWGAWQEEQHVGEDDDGSDT